MKNSNRYSIITSKQPVNNYFLRMELKEARWAFIARACYLMYECETGEPYYNLMELLKGKNYHIMTTNQDTQFTRVVSEDKLSAIQGDWRYFQCDCRCHDEIYYNKEQIYEMNAAIDDNLCIPTSMIPKCPKCGGDMEPWVRGYTFLEGKKYREEHRKINTFLEKNRNKKILFPDAFYITINPRDAILPEALKKKGAAIHEDIAVVLRDAVKQKLSGKLETA